MKKGVAAFFVGLLIVGCMGGVQPSMTVNHYALEYPFPRFENLSRIGEIIRMERFTASRTFHSNEMVFRPKPYMREIYNYHRWDIMPADMVTELITRDIGNAGVFKSVLSYRDPGNARFLLEGKVEEFMEVDDGNRSWASLIVLVTFWDSSGQNTANRVILQKKYNFREPVKKRQPHELAKAMSTAMEKLSKELIMDVYNAAGASI
jgi:ABC-type uncharacterized transport system auxiliary subunit